MVNKKNTHLQYSQDMTLDSIEVIDSNLDAEIIRALKNHDYENAGDIISTISPADIAGILERLNKEERQELLTFCFDSIPAMVYAELELTTRVEIISKIGIKKLIEVIRILPADDVVHFISGLDKILQEEIVSLLPHNKKFRVNALLVWPENSAGRIMHPDPVTVPQGWKIGGVIDWLREMAEYHPERFPSTFYNIYIVDEDFKPIGSISLNKLLQAPRSANVKELMSSKVPLLEADSEKKDIAYLFRQQDLVSAAVVNRQGVLVGAITIDDAVDVMHEESENEILRLGGVKESSFNATILKTALSRIGWLVINLFTATLGALVVSNFSGAIQAIVALAILMPIASSMGGNAGTQTLTIAVRAIATHELTSINTLRSILKEVGIGLINGACLAILTGLGTYIFFGNIILSIIIGLALIVNLIAAGFAGISIPIIMNKLGFDPAISSSIFLTTITDVTGYLVFLGLASAILL